MATIIANLCVISIAFLLVPSTLGAAFINKEVKSTEDFKYIGSYKGPSNGHLAFDGSEYYESVHTAKSWSDAADKCKSHLPGLGNQTSTLMAIETEDEWLGILEELKDTEYDVPYWIGGQWDSARDVWVWESHKHDLPNEEWVPWASNHPLPGSISRKVALHFMDDFTSTWETITDNREYKYICEVPRSTIPVPCYNPNDLVIVLDSSGSITSPEFDVAKKFVADLTTAFTKYSENRISFVLFSSTVQTIINLDNTMTPAEIDEKIMSTAYLGQDTSTNLGIAAAISQFVDHKPRDVLLNMVVLTDGRSNNPNQTAIEANKAKASGIRGFSVGIGASVFQSELLTIAGGIEANVFKTEDIDGLINILTPLSKKVCTY